ncbi:MAG TPA: hypothetical protein VN952_09845 [Chthoniobacterales bacterium]|nr:hypothetical protein [Chthoniobacterales bacterium]
MGRWEILTGSADPPGSAKALADKPGSASKSVVNLKDCQNRRGSTARSVPERGRSGYVLRGRQAGVSLVEMSVALFLLTAVAVFGFQTMISGWMLQNSSIMQSMTDAYAGIETGYAQRWTFANIPTSGRWPVYPASTSAVVTIGKTPKGPVNATVVRTSHQYTDPLTLAQSYMLESYVVYKDELRQYCKVSKVYRTE